MTDSWWLKVKRAQQHMVDIQRVCRVYADNRPFRFDPVPQPKRKRDLRWNLRITDQPDPMLALIVGDFVHNLRSALDHVIVASIPEQTRSNKTAFPWSSVDIFAKGAAGDFKIKNDDVRKEFDRCIAGLHPDARAIVIRAQPYHVGIAQAHQVVLGLIGRLDTADKHRELATFGAGVQNLWVDITYRGFTGRLRQTNLPTAGFAIDGTVIGWGEPDGAIESNPEDISPEVHMDFGGTAVVFIKVMPMHGKKSSKLSNLPLITTSVLAIRETRRVLRLMEPFIIR